ncbi:MAG: DUF2318 domain-containing protein [Propionibacteriaceae bacterium]|jgi:uncharacterized membrane protein|nr:DUF2318 domain-containing protein [Propionibacteriaceae bacterium]
MLSQLVQVVAGTAPAVILLALLGTWEALNNHGVPHERSIGRCARRVPTVEHPIHSSDTAQESHFVHHLTGNTALITTPVGEQRSNRTPHVIRWGVLLGLTAAIVLVLLRETTRLVNRELVTFSATSVLIVLELALVTLAWVALRKNGGNATSTAQTSWGSIRFGSTLTMMISTLVLFTALPGVLLQLTSFIVAGQPIFTTATLARVVGFILGAILVIVTGLALTKASEATSPTAVVIVLTSGIACWLLSQLVTLTQIAVARSWIRLPTSTFRMLIWAINQQGLLLPLLLLVALVLPLRYWKANRLAAQANTTGHPRERLGKAAARQRHVAAKMGLFGATAILLTITAGAAVANHKPELSEPEPYDIIGTQAVIPLTAVDDGHLHRFAYTTTTGVTVRFIVVQKNAVAYGVGLDACEICGPTGYLERAGQIICRLCDVVMNIATIGFRGGCNPIPLEHTIRDGMLIIELADLEQAESVFA